MHPNTASREPVTHGRHASGHRVGGKYVVRRFVAPEPTGEVYYGVDARNQRAVTLHVIDPTLVADSGELRQALTEGADRAQSVMHDAVVETLDFVDGSDGTAVVTARAEGPLLGDYIEEYGPLPVDIAVTLFAEIAGCLLALERVGLNHGALYPGHVRVSLDGERMRPSLEGLHTEPIVEHVPALAEALAPYRAGELAGSLGIVDDVFAFGAMFVHVLTGEVPGTPAAGKELGALDGLDDAVRGMLGQCLKRDPAGRFQSMVAVRNVLQELVAGAERARQKSPERPEPGDVVAGQYEIEDVLGEGGMARVYLARDQELGTRVAVKLLNATCASEDEVVDRFLEEASIQARLVHPEPHPNIVAVLRVLHEEPVGYVMEYVEGCTFEDLFFDEVLSETELLEIFAQIADGLHHAHENRIVHRDLKPSNVLMSRDEDGGWRAKLMDFGISKQLDQPKTRTNLVLGTLGYISPELFISAKDASPSSDVYALGCCMFEAITGDLPFSPDVGLRSLAFRVYNEKPPTPTSLGASISEGLEALIMMSLAKDPEDRPPSAKWLADRLRKLKTGQADAEISAAIGHVRSGEMPTAREVVGQTTMRGAAGATTSRTSAAVGTRERPRPPVAVIIAAVLVILGLVGLGIYLVVGTEEEAPAPVAEPQPEPEPETQPEPEPEPEPTKTVLPASRVLGADELLAQARARAAEGDKRAALELYDKALARLDEEGDSAPEDVSDTLVEKAELARELADETVADDEEVDAETAAEARALLAEAATAYGRAAELSQDATLFGKKAALDQERGDASSALEALRKVVELSDDEEARKAAQDQIDRIERAYEEGSDEDEDSKSRIPQGPLPPNMIEVWIESKPERARVYLDGRRVGKTPMIKRLPKTSETLRFTIKKSSRYYTEKLDVDGNSGGKFAVKLAWRPREID